MKDVVKVRFIFPYSDHEGGPLPFFSHSNCKVIIYVHNISMHNIISIAAIKALTRLPVKEAVCVQSINIRYSNFSAPRPLET